MRAVAIADRRIEPERNGSPGARWRRSRA
jgi:hypothetical protein